MILVNTTKNTNNFLHTNLSPNSSPYLYEMKTVYLDSETGYFQSNPSSIGTKSLPPAPDQITGLKGYGKSNGEQIELTWNTSSISEYGGYVLKWKEFSDSNNNDWISTTTPYNIESFLLGGGGIPFLNSSSAYQIEITPFESDLGCTEQYRSFAPTSEIIVPPPPKNFELYFHYDADEKSITYIKLNWQASKKASYYRIERQINKEGDFSEIATTTDLFFTDNNATTTNYLYSYKVQACNNETPNLGCSAFTPIKTQKIVNAPQNLTVKNIDFNKPSVSLEWENTFPENNYIIYKSEGDNLHYVTSGLPVLPHKDDAFASSTDEQVELGKIYYYKVMSQFLGNIYSESSNEVFADINPSSTFRGWAWSGYKFPVNNSYNYIVTSSYAVNSLNSETPVSSLENNKILSKNFDFKNLFISEVKAEQECPPNDESCDDEEIPPEPIPELNKPWTNPNNAKSAPNNLFAYVGFGTKGGNSQWLKLNYFNNFNIPSSAKINGIEIIVKGYENGSGKINVKIGLYNPISNTWEISDNKEITLSPQYRDYAVGSISTNVWNLNLSPSNINSPNFAVFIQGFDNFSSNIYIDSVEVKIAYDPSANDFNNIGAGWISFCGGEGTFDCPGDVSYSVAVGATGKNELSGYAWSSNYGWLSFNKSDLEKCPDDNCIAKLENNKLIGWAKFLNPDNQPDNPGSFSKWLSLSGATTNGKHYGICYGKTLNENTGECKDDLNVSSTQFTGYGWGGDVLGWVSFSGDNYAVTYEGKKSPILNNLTSGVNEITVEWENPIDYTKVGIWVAEDKNKDEKIDLNDPDEDFQERRQSSHTSQGGPYTETITGLESDTLYRVKIRGGF